MWCTGIAEVRPRARRQRASTHSLRQPAAAPATRPEGPASVYATASISFAVGPPAFKRGAGSGSTVFTYVIAQAGFGQLRRRRSQRVISPDYTIGWLQDLFHRRQWQVPVSSRRMFQCQVPHDLFYLALLPRSVG